MEAGDAGSRDRRRVVRERESHDGQTDECEGLGPRRVLVHSGIQFRALACVKTPGLAATELSPSRHVPVRGALMRPRVTRMPLELAFRPLDRGLELLRTL